MLRATARYQGGDASGAVSAARHALTLEADPASRWRAVALATLGGGLFWLDAASPETDVVVEEAVAHAEPGKNSLAVLRALGVRAALRLDAGDADAARELAGRALRIRDEERLDEYWMWSLAGAVDARLLVAAGDHAAAIATAGRAAAVARRGSARLEEAYALATLAPMHAAAGDAQEAADALRAARAVVRRCPDPGRLVQLLAVAERATRARTGEDGPGGEGLTEREREVLRLLATRMTLADIADVLFVTRNTVKTHVRTIYRKLGAADRSEAVARAREGGLL
jgi:LuxR family maltose regulon positive regulatory protein